MGKTYDIKIGESELRLISNALDLYARIGIGQFYMIDNHPSVNKALFNKELQGEFRNKSYELATIYTGMSGNGSFGIFNKTIGDENRIAFNIHQSIRHLFWQQREEKPNYTVDSTPADACRISGIPEPVFEIKVSK